MANTTWKQLVYDAANAYRTASATETQVKVGELATKISSLEDVTAEVEVQTPLVDQIIAELQDKVVISPELEEKTATPSAEDQIIMPTAGKYLSKVTVDGDSNFIAENIKNGVEIWGVTGTMPEGVTGISYGQFTVTNRSSVTVNHSLGVKPKAVMMYPISLTGSQTHLIFHINPYFTPGIQGKNYYGYIIRDGDYSPDSLENGAFAKSTATTITFHEYNSRYPISGTYGWIAIA